MTAASGFGYKSFAAEPARVVGPEFGRVRAMFCNQIQQSPVINWQDAVGKSFMPEDGLDVAQCVRQVRLGDEDAARALLNHLYPLVIKLVRAHLPRRTEEADLAQIIFMKIFAKLDQFSGQVPLGHWVSRIAVNTCLNQIESERIRPELRYADLSEEQEQVLERVVATPEDIHPSQGLAARELVGKVLTRLTPPERLVINLMYFEGLSVEEVKRTTGWNAALIKVRAFRARRKMKRHLQRLLEEKKP
jgi:RNA polymerase sigma-70 factor (ECF subfamily)